VELAKRRRAADASLLRHIVPLLESSNDNTGGPDSRAPLAEEETAIPPQGDLF